ncbi:MAG: PorV/PorQ family protein [bacterium]
MNWWENSVNASKANWQYCQDKGYEGWGLTACEGPDSNYYCYGAPPCGEHEGPKDDGTLTPYGAGSSIAFSPNESIQALKHYFKNTDIWRYLFGFGDTYNSYNATVTNYYNGPWYNHVYFGIDQGPMLIGIENYRSGLVWNRFMQNGCIREALQKIFYSPYSVKGKVKDSEGKEVSQVKVELSGDTSATYWTKEDGGWVFEIPSIGGNLKMVHSELAQTSKATAFVCDVGGIYRLPVGNLTIGGVIQNIGSKLKYEEEGDALPLNIKLGVAYRRDDLLVALDIVKPIEEEIKVNVGMEYWIVGTFALRAGCKFYKANNKSNSDTTLGAGLRINNYQLDYAYVPRWDLGNAHQISLLAKF